MDERSTPVEITNRGPIATQIVDGPIAIRIVSVKMRWGDMFTLIVQFLICSIPAVLMIAFFWSMLVASFIGGLLGLGHAALPHPTPGSWP